MASLYLDEDIQNAATDLLREYGHAVTHARDYQKSAKDDVQLLLAARAGWILVTNNQRDFFLLHGAWHHWSTAWGVTPRHEDQILVPTVRAETTWSLGCARDDEGTAVLSTRGPCWNHLIPRLRSRENHTQPCSRSISSPVVSRQAHGWLGMTN